MQDKSKNTLQALQFSGLRGSDVIREVSLPVGDRVIRIAVVHGLVNAKKLLRDIEQGLAYYDLIEVMTCKTGCVGGAGQPIGLTLRKQLEGPLNGRAHELLHVHYDATGDSSLH